MKTLEIGKNYGMIFGLDSEKGQELIYNGGNSWTARQPGGERTIESTDTTAKALAYINKPSVSMGSF